MNAIHKYTVVMHGITKNETKEVFASSPSFAIERADPKGRYRNYTVYQDGKEIKKRHRL